MLVFIAVLSGVVAGVAAGSLTPLLVLRLREQRLADPGAPPDHDPSLASPVPEPDGTVPPPSWARGEPGDAEAPSAPAADPDDRLTQPLGDTDLWEGWGSQGTFDDLWQPEDARPPLPATLLAAVRRGRDRLGQTAHRAIRLGRDQPAEEATAERPGRAKGAWRTVQTRVARLPREHLAIAGMVAVAVIAAVGLGILASQPSDEVVHVTVDRQPEPSSEPYLIEVDVPASPAPTSEPRSAAPAAEAPAPRATPAPAPSGPDVSAAASCGAEGLQVDFTLSDPGGDLEWFTLYVDGSPVTGGPLQGSEHSGTYAGEGGPGSHDVELVGTNGSGARSVDRAQVDCPAPA